MKNQKQNNENLAYSIAWSFIKRNNNKGIDPQDLQQEAILAYYEALASFNEEKGNILTYIYSMVKNRLLTFIQNHEKHMDTLTDVDWVEYGSKDTSFELQPRAAQNEAIELVLQSEKDFGQFQARTARAELVNEMREAGRSWEYIWDTMREAKELVRGGLAW